jgi:hypothetical protein
MKTHWSINVVKRYHAELRRAYQMINDDFAIEVSREIMLQMIVKAINDTIDFDDLMFILLMFETYFRMHVINFSTSSIIQRIMIIEKEMIEIRKFRVERQIINALNIWNDSIITSIHDLFLNSNVLVWRENNVNQRDKWTESFKLLSIENETCKIALSFELIDFRSIVKTFIIKISEFSRYYCFSSERWIVKSVWRFIISNFYFHLRELETQRNKWSAEETRI